MRQFELLDIEIEDIKKDQVLKWYGILAQEIFCKISWELYDKFAQINKIDQAIDEAEREVKEGAKPISATEAKLAVTEHYLGDKDSIVMDDAETMSREEFLKELKISFIAYYRSGKRVYSLDFPWVRGDKDGVVVLFDENDKATVLEDSDFDRNFMSLIYPEQSDEEA